MNNLNKKNGKICIYIEPYVHVNIINNGVLLYNTLDGRRLLYENSPAIAALLGIMMAPENLNAIIREKAFLDDEGFQKFLESARSRQMINWYDLPADGCGKKPVGMPPILNFHRDREILARDADRGMGIEIKKYLHKLTIYVNCYHGAPYDTPLFEKAFKQFLFPYSAQEYSQLKFSRIQSLLESVKDLGFCVLSVLGGNIFHYLELPELMSYLAQFPLKKELGVFYKDVTSANLKRLEKETLTNISFRIFVEPEVDKKQLVNGMELMNDLGIDVKYQFAIKSEEDAVKMGEFVEGISPDRLSLKPFYDGRNYKFFRENIFVEESDLSAPVVSKKDIYARSKMNTNAFGNFTVLSCGDVYSNINEAPVGTIDMNLNQLLENEMSRGDGWFKLRKNLAPCDHCVYHTVCPPVSNYEAVLTRNDLCWRQPPYGGDE